MSPVPANRHLEWNEVRDFTPGLWETGDWLIPPGGAATLTDAYPQKGGGLRAFFKPTTLAMTGIGAGERIIGIYGITQTRSGVTGVDYYCVTFSTANKQPRIYRWDKSDPAQTQWTLKLTLMASANDDPTGARFTGYTLTAGTKRIIISISYVHADAGLYAATITDTTAAQTFAKITGTLGGPVGVHQNRLIEGRTTSVYFTGAGGESFAAGGFVNIEPQRNLADVRAFIPIAPSDLLVGSQGSSWTAIQGDLTDPVVRTMSSAHYPGVPQQTVVDMGEGVAFIEQTGGIYLTAGGSSFQRLDKQLQPNTGNPALEFTLGDLVFEHDWLFAPKGYIFDVETRAWFRAGNTQGAYHGFVNRLNNEVVQVVSSPPAIYVYSLAENGSRVNSYTWKSGPLRAVDGRQVEVREAQLALRTYNALSSVTVTINGQARSSGTLAAGSQVVAIPFRERTEVLDVQVVPNSGDSVTEAPSIEVVRIGHRSGHRVA